MYTINKSIEKLKKEIEEKKEQITLLENWKSLEFTEENYHKLCETCFRGSEELGKKFEEVFPFLNFIKASPNEYTYLLKINNINYRVIIPCISIRNITIIIPCPFDYQIEENDLHNINKQIEKIEEKLNAKTIFERSNYVAGYYKKPFRILAYLIKYKNKKNYIKRLTEIKEVLEKRQNSYINKIEEIKKEQKEYNEIIEIFMKNFSPKFLNWTNEIIIKANKDSIFSRDIRIKRKEN